MSRAAVIACVAIFMGAGHSTAQVGGGMVFAQQGGKGAAKQREREKRLMTKDDLPPDDKSMFVDANVLLNVKADSYVAVFGLSVEGTTVADCQKAMDAKLKRFFDALAAAGVNRNDVFVDFISQNKVYGFELAENVAREKLVGFEFKKNVSIRYRERDKLDALVNAAALAEIFDLVKVDYVIEDTSAIREQLMDEAAKVIERKAKRYERLFGTHVKPPAQVYAERFNTHSPSEMYDAYTAFEGEAVDAPREDGRITIQHARKNRTFFFNALDTDGFDVVVDPVVLEPVVQCTLYVKVRYAIEAAK